MASSYSGLSHKKIDILMAEDNPGDVRLTREAFKRGRLQPNLHVAANGDLAMAFLRREGTFANSVRPNLIMLDLNMPGKHGTAILSEIKRDPDLDCIPVIVFSSSSSEADIAKCYKLQASCFITKPADIAEFREAILSVENFWLKTARLPDHCAE